MTIKNKFWLVGILLFASLNILLFWPANLYFLNDDLLHIPLTDQGYLFQTNSVRPVHELLLRLELYVWHKHAFGYHITALLLHFIVCLQFYNLSLIVQTRWLKASRQQAVQGASLGVILFLIYPQSSESLGWILGRAPVLSAIFFMVTIRLFFVENFKPTIYITGALFFAITLFAYEQSILVPAALFLTAYPERKSAKGKAMLKYVAALTIVALIYIIIRKIVTSEVVGMYEGGNLLRMNVGTLAANFFRILFRLILNPAARTTFIFTAFVLVSIVGLILLLAIRLPINKKTLAFFSANIVLLVLPVVSLGIAVNSYESGRYLYLPSIFLIMSVGIGFFQIINKGRQIKTMLRILIIILITYWLKGKIEAGKCYADASLYSKTIELKIHDHFINSSDTLYLDTLHVTIHRLPVFRRGFKTGVNWLNNRVDTNKVVVKNLYDEVLHRELE